MRVKEESRKASLKFNIQKPKIMASGPITSWQIDGEKVDTVADFIFLNFKITTDSDCSHEIKRCLLLGRKAMTNWDSILKRRDIILLRKSVYSKLCFFSSHVQMWKLNHKKGWVPKNWCFWTVVLEKTLERPLECKESNQSILKEINPKYSLEGLMLKLKLQYFDHMVQRAESLEKTLIMEKIEGKRGDGRGWAVKLASPWTWICQTPEDSGGQRGLVGYSHAVTKNWTWLSNWTITIRYFRDYKLYYFNFSVHLLVLC